jgi:acetyl-CoA carboxylase biotin carboxyl carrier protein
MTIDEIKELLVLFNESGVGELEIEREGERIRIRKAGMATEYSIPPALAQEPMVAVDAAPRDAAATTTTSGTPPGVSPASADSGHILVKSPIVGTYYDAASPGSAPFVNVGDTVEPGQVLCIIESMKLMNEIEAETAGVIIAKLVENGRPVEYGEALFSIKPR